MTMQQRLGLQEATRAILLDSCSHPWGEAIGGGGTSPADRRWHAETMLLEDRVVLQATATPVVGLTPAQVQTAYGINSIRLHGVIGNGAGQTIAVVDTGDDPGFVNSTDPTAERLTSNSVCPTHPASPRSISTARCTRHGGRAISPTAQNLDSGETALDVEWAHAIAPGASIVLVEAKSFDIGEIAPVGKTPATSNYATAIRTAASLPGVSVVSMSFGTPEFATEHNWDSVFTTPPGHPNVTFLSGSGDSHTSPDTPTTRQHSGDFNGDYPAFSPNVVAVGGTTLSLNSDNSYKGEVAWNQIPSQSNVSSGGISATRARAGLPAGRQSHQQADHP